MNHTCPSLSPSPSPCPYPPSPPPPVAGKGKQKPWRIMESFRGWSCVIYQMLFQKIHACNLKKPFPLPTLHDFTCIVTGSTNGIGLEIAKQLAFSEARVVLAVRNITIGYDLIQKWQDEWPGTSQLKVEVMELNLLSLKSVVKFAEQWNSSSKPQLQVLVNNAGIFSRRDPQKFSKDGYDAHMQVNHFAPALLSILLLPSLVKGSPSRIVNVNSVLYSAGYFDIKNLNSPEKNLKYNSSKAYSNSKLAQVMFSSILQKNLPLQAGISVVCVSPGRVTRGLPQTVPCFPVRVQDGARSALFAATDPQIPKYCKEMKDKESLECAYISFDCQPVKKASKKAKNMKVANEVWEKTLDMIGLPPDALERILLGEEIKCLVPLK